MASNNDINQRLKEGIAQAKAGNKPQARTLLESVIAQDDRNELAWLWLASVVATQRERRVCLERVLQLNPNNDRARQALNQLSGGATTLGEASASAVSLTPKPRPERNNQTARLLAVGATLVVIAALSFLLSPTSAPEIAFSPTPDTQAMAVLVSPTPAPTLTPAIVMVTTRDLPTLPPTFTPTFTPTPTVTPLPSPTPFSLGEYRLLYSTRAGLEPQPSVYEVFLDGTGQRPLLEGARDIAFDALGEQVVFVRDVTTPSETEGGAETISGELFLAPANAPEQARQLTAIRTASAYTPSFSPDGKQIAFASDYTGNLELFIYDIASGLTTRLTDNTFIDRDPHWSPDGKQIVFASDRESPLYTKLFLLTLTEGEPQVTRLNNDSGNSTSPKWSPNGQRIVYVNDSSGNADIATIGADGQRRTALVTHPSEDKAPQWSPDGRFVAFVSNREEDTFQAYWVEPPNRTITRINRDGRETLTLVWYPSLLLRVIGQGR